MSFYRAKPRKGLRRRPFLGAPSRLSPDRTGGPVISKLEEKDTYDVRGAKSDGHGGARSSCQKQESVNLVIKRIPDFRSPAEYRLMFVDSPGKRPSLEHHIRGTEDLLQFLQGTLAQPAHVVSRVVGELESSYGATAAIGSLRTDPDELAALLRMQEKEEQQRARAVRE